MPQGKRPTPEQKAAREQLADARKKKLERKKRTRNLIQMGGVLKAYGFESTEQVDALMQDLVKEAENREWLQQQGANQTDRWAVD